MTKRREKRILAISGSTKSKSTSLSIIQFIKERYHGDVEIDIFNRIAELPHFNPELESELPEAISDLRNLIEKADGVLFCTPEYVYSLPGSLKNLIEWNVSTVLFSNKPVAIIVAAASGKKAFESLDLILTTIEASLPDESKLLIQGAKGKMGSDGKIESEVLISEIDKVVSSLKSTIENKDRKPTKFTEM